MAKNKIKNKRGSLMSVALIIVAITTIFFGLVYFMNENLASSTIYDSANDSVFPAMNESLAKLEVTQGSIETNTQNILTAITNITESESILTTGLYAFRGTTNALLLLGYIFNYATQSFDAIKAPFSSMPGWVWAAFSVIILVYIIFTLLKSITGRTEI